MEDADLSGLEVSEPTPQAKQIAELEQQLQKLKESQEEERFIYAVVAVIAVDSHLFSHMPGWAGPISILALELILLLVLARRFGVDDVAVWFDKALAAFRTDRASNS